MENPARSTHPLILAAAASVTIASLAAAAYFTGLLPARTGEPAPLPVAAAGAPAVAEVAPPVARTEPAPPPEASRPAARPPAPQRSRETAPPAPRPDAQVREQRQEDGTRRVSTNNAGIDVIPSPPATAPAPAPAPASAICRDCGTVESVREIAARGEGSGLGAVAGGVLGGILGNQVGKGSGRDLATIAGAVGGAVAGHQVEKNVRTDRQFQVNVRFDDGSVRSFTQANPAWRSGDRVRLADGELVAADHSRR